MPKAFHPLTQEASLEGANHWRTNRQAGSLFFVIEETVGTEFEESKLIAAQNRAWQVLNAVAKDLRPGMTELDAHKILKERIAESGAEKIWHPSQIRFGKNTIHSFGEKAEPVPLNENDHLFMDIGPVYDGYEGDVGATYVLGNDPHLTRLSEDSKIIFDEVKKHWSTTGTTGEALYAFAEESARSRGWKLNPNGASGHRVSEFPHSAHYRGKLKSFERQPTPYRWILEIQLFDETRKLGSFFEDLL